MQEKLKLLRNIGISAHIDSGKTTLTERILFYAGKIHRMGDVRDGSSGATMDHMELEKERGITITSAATTVAWKGCTYNIIDTPGHVDFTVEVERSLRVLDGGILVLCGVAGVQSQSLTIDRQMKRHQVPCIAFINKIDRSGANPFRVIEDLCLKLGHNAVAMQIPIGLEADHQGVVDLVTQKAYYFEGEKGRDIRETEIPSELLDQANKYREILLNNLSLYSDELTSLMLDDVPIPVEVLHQEIRKATLSRSMTPVFMGSAARNKGIQALMDGISNYLPSPIDRSYSARHLQSESTVPLYSDPNAPLVCMGFKIVNDNYGQLTYIRVYQGSVKQGDVIWNVRTQKSARVNRILRMHSDKREEIAKAEAGDIVALFGVDCASGDTFVGTHDLNVSLENIYVAEPVIEYSIKVQKTEDLPKLSRALERFVKEDPTFRVYFDEETGETRISGMGELHLDIYIERIRREYAVPLLVSQPQVHYREAPSQIARFNYKHKKQTGGAGQYAHIVGEIFPIVDDTEDTFVFTNKTFGGAVPKEYISAVEKGFKEAIKKGPSGYKVIKMGVTLTDGGFHPVDSSEMAFIAAAKGAFREAFQASKPKILEPIMKVEVETPIEFQGTVQGDLSSRRGYLHGCEMRGDYAVIMADVPLEKMFGYATNLRSLTQGKAGFTMEFKTYTSR